jgi:exodeoxyribonuclease-3
MNARSRNVGWRIDYFLVSAKIMKRVKKAFILDQVEGSDHCPVGIEID